MILIVGLGNPGKKYEKTRHNVGYRVIDELAKDKPEDFILAKPKTFMNESGKAIKSLYAKYKIQNTKYLIVVHDDIDLFLGTFKIGKNWGSAGHKGVQSIIDELKTKGFNRIRIGICPQTGKPKQVDKFVLQNFTKAEEKTMKKVVEQAIQAVQAIKPN